MKWSVVVPGIGTAFTLNVSFPSNVSSLNIVIQNEVLTCPAYNSIYFGEIL